MSRKEVLVVEDERDIADLLALHLKDFDCDVTVASDGHEAMRLGLARDWDLVILDLRLPGPDGLTICRALRRESRYVPILMLTAKSTELDRVVGLETGADDYLAKPFGIPELQARVKALLRRVEALAGEAAADRPDEKLIRDGLTIEVERRQVWVDGREVQLTAREFDLLLFFARHPGRVFNRGQLLDQVWGYNHDGYQHTVNSHINRLRAKVEQDPAQPRFILTVWGIGYKFAESRNLT